MRILARLFQGLWALLVRLFRRASPEPQEHDHSIRQLPPQGANQEEPATAEPQFALPPDERPELEARLRQDIREQIGDVWEMEDRDREALAQQAVGLAGLRSRPAFDPQNCQSHAQIAQAVEEAKTVIAQGDACVESNEEARKALPPVPDPPPPDPPVLKQAASVFLGLAFFQPVYGLVLLMTGDDPLIAFPLGLLVSLIIGAVLTFVILDASPDPSPSAAPARLGADPALIYGACFAFAFFALRLLTQAGFALSLVFFLMELGAMGLLSVRARKRRALQAAHERALDRHKPFLDRIDGAIYRRPGLVGELQALLRLVAEIDARAFDAKEVGESLLAIARAEIAACLARNRAARSNTDESIIRRLRAS